MDTLKWHCKIVFPSFICLRTHTPNWIKCIKLAINAKCGLYCRNLFEFAACFQNEIFEFIFAKCVSRTHSLTHSYRTFLVLFEMVKKEIDWHFFPFKIWCFSYEKFLYHTKSFVFYSYLLFNCDLSHHIH